LSAAPARIALLGPQRAHPNVDEALSALGAKGRVAVVTAGWQEWEDDEDRMRALVGDRGVNLHLYGRAERVWRADSELAAAHHALQERVRVLRRAYNVRLARAMEAWIELERLDGDPAVVEGERGDAMNAVRALDRHHEERLRELRQAFYDRYDPLMRGAVAREREEIRSVVGNVDAVVVAGGHVAVLLNRLRLFGVDELLGGRSVVACAGGAMVLGSRVVLFHDSPPWGPGHAEVGEYGLGLYPSVIPFPDGTARLRLDDPGRVGRMARRFAPAECIVLDEGTRLVLRDGAWRADGALRLDAAGGTGAWAGAA
jgi:hypothetical protein